MHFIFQAKHRPLPVPSITHVKGKGEISQQMAKKNKWLEAEAVITTLVPTLHVNIHFEKLPLLKKLPLCRNTVVGSATFSLKTF